MVQFNPFFRPSIEECLSHPYFNRVRKLEKEETANNNIEIELDKMDGEPNLNYLGTILEGEIDFFQ